MRNRFLDWGLVATAIAMALMAAVVGYMMVLNAEARRDRFDAPVTYYATQVDYELLTLMDAIHRFGEGDPEVSRDDMITRLDILWSRVAADNRAGRAMRYLQLDGAEGMLQKVAEELTASEMVILELERSDHVGAHALTARLRPLLQLTHSVAMEAIAQDAQIDEAYRLRHETQAQLTVGLVAGTVIFGLFSLFRLRSDRQRLARAALDLEEKVRERTSDLENANRELSEQIEERRQDTLELQERGERLNQAARLAKLGYYVWDCVEDRCEYCSEQHARSHGVTPAEFMARASSSLSFVHQDDADMVREKFQEVGDGKVVMFDHRVLTPDGVRYIREVVRPITDAHGEIVKEIASSIDMTDHINTEKKLHEAQRLESLGKLSGGVAHDFNNLLAVILGNLELLRAGEESRERVEMLEDALSAVFRGQDLTRTMLAFARRAPLNPKPTNLNTIVQGMENMIRRLLPANISFETSLAAAPWQVLADRSGTENALLNLIVNARDAMQDGGELTIEISNVRIDQEYIEFREESVAPGRYVLLAVTDTGCGIADADQKRIFEPFFSTKDMATNSGLGLSMIDGFVRQSDGIIRVYSEQNVGTTFKIYLPTVHEPDGDDAGGTKPDVSIEVPGLKILLVEDNELVRRTLKKTLEIEGMIVLEAQDSASAERAFKKNPDVHLLLTDIVMPGDLQGPALAGVLRGLRADLPVIFMSGYPQEAAVHGNGLRPEDIRLMKPVSRSDLLTAINQVLSNSPLDSIG